MVSDFTISTIGNTCHVTDGAHSKVKRQDSGVLYLTSKNIKAGSLSLDKVDYISEEDYERLFPKDSKAKRRLQNGDVLIGIIGTFGNAYRYKKDDLFGISSSIAILRPNPKYLDSDFLYYVVTGEVFKAFHLAYQSGSVQGYTNISTIKELPVPVPPLADQEAIAHILGTLDDKIELNRQMNETLEAMAQALFKSWFVDFDPVIDNALLAGNDIPEPLKERAEMRQAQLDSGKAKTNSEINKLFPSEFEFTEELGWIPKDWRVSSLENLADISSSKRIFAKEYLTEGVPFYRGKEISLLSKGEDVSSEIYISQERFMELKDKFGAPKEGDILLTSVGTLGNAYLVNSEDEFYFKDGNLTWFKDYKTLIKGEYLYYWLKSREAKLAIDNITIGSTQQALTISSLNGIKIVKPNDSAIKTFNESIIPIIVKSVYLKKNRVALAKIRDTLLPKLMSGELRIADAEKLVAEII